MAVETRPEAEVREQHSRESVEPEDYAAINAVYGVLLVGVVLATRERVKADPIRRSELLPMGAATFAVSKVIAREKIGTWVREPFVEDASHGGKPRGRRIQRAVGELVTCSRCVGAWSALGVVGLRAASPDVGRLVTSVLATSALNDWAQAGFAWLRGKANQVPN
ncbi:MAG TPA: DUF1360 domain-containing protein [Thermoleophilaceae bacterium]